MKNQFEMSDFIAGFWRLASWHYSPQQRLSLIEHYLDLGVTTMDHADIYGQLQCEILFGEALSIKPSLRTKIQLISKCGIKPTFESAPERYVNHYDTSEQHIFTSVDNSLTRLGTDHLDLLLIHRPDPLMNADEVALTFKKLQQSGKVLHFGVSNFSTGQFELLQSRLTPMNIQLITNQVEISPYNMTSLHDGTLEQCQQHRISPMAWSCLSGGEIFTSQSAQAIRLRTVLNHIANNHCVKDISPIVYAWINALPSQPKPIIGSGNVQRIKNAISSKSISLDKQEWFSIWEASTGHSVP
ncbi:aldo/keto reductase [Shewanella sp. VB17]|nr:aldo/keto reductase [Shewanella sp. VB17]